MFKLDPRYGILVAMHAYGLGGKPLGSVAKFTDLCRAILGEEAMPNDEHLVCGTCGGQKSWEVEMWNDVKCVPPRKKSRVVFTGI